MFNFQCFINTKNDSSIQLLITRQVDVFHGKLENIVITLPYGAYINCEGLTRSHNLKL